MDISTFVGAVKFAGSFAIKHVRRSNAADRLRCGSQLFVVQPEHWLFPMLCQYKRHRRARDIAELKRQSSASLDDTKTRLLHKLLAGGTGVCADPDRLKAVVLNVTSILCAQRPQYEPFLVELALVHCVSAWADRAGSAADVRGFEAFLVSELDGDQARDWFNCQFLLDENGLLGLAPLFYKERVTNPSVRDLVALCVAETSNDLWACSNLLIKRLAKEKNKAAFDAWMIWVADTFAMVGPPVGVEDASPSSLGFMSQHVMNATQLIATKRIFIAIGLHHPAFVTRDYNNLRGVIFDRKASDNERIKNGLGIYVGAGKV